MSHTNANVRSLRDQFEQQQKHDISFQCIHCGKHQSLIIIFQTNLKKGTRDFSNENFILNRKFVVKFYAQVHLEIYQCPCPQNLFTLYCTSCTQ